MSIKGFLVIFSLIILFENIFTQYGQTGNSQIGSNSGTKTSTNSPINTPTNNNPTSTSTNDYGQNTNINTPPSGLNNPSNPSLSTNCNESDSTSVCISKPTCCHVTNFYSGFTYSACIDVRNSANFEKFCSNFYSLNNKEGFTTSECVCSGNKKYYGP